MFRREFQSLVIDYSCWLPFKSLPYSETGHLPPPECEFFAPCVIPVYISVADPVR
jgi:hypothetical protein